jgi:hypothetical protein
VWPSPLLLRPAMEDLLTATLWSRHVFGKMPQTCRVAYRSVLIEVLWDFVNVDVEQPDAETAQAQAYGNMHMSTNAVARGLYPGEVGAGDMAADAAALRERIVKVKHRRLALVTLRHEAVAAAEDATHRRSLSQRRAIDLEAKKFKDIARVQAFAEQESYRRAFHALMSGSPADLRDPAVLAAVRALHPNSERPAVRAPLEDLPPVPTITMTAIKKAVRKMDICAAAGPDGMPVLHVSGLMWSTAGDGGVEKGVKALVAFMQGCANGDLTPCVARCFGTAKNVSIHKNAASGVAGVKDLGFIGSWRQEQTIELTRARLI